MQNTLLLYENNKDKTKNKKYFQVIQLVFSILYSSFVKRFKLPFVLFLCFNLLFHHVNLILIPFFISSLPIYIHSIECKKNEYCFIQLIKKTLVIAGK